jgi:TPR repeat protein
MFELEGVSLLPVFRRTTRGFVLVRDAGVLAPLTPLRIRCLTPVGQEEVRVVLSGVIAGRYVLGGLGRRIEGCRNRFEVASADYHRGMELFFGGGHPAAVHAWELAAMRGHAESMTVLGELSRWKDRRVSLQWFEKAAANGHPTAMAHIAEMCLDDGDMRVDGMSALRWLRKAVDLGSVYAMGRLAHLFRDGVGVPVDKAEAMGWFRKAYGMGSAGSANCVGMMYARGEGVRMDDKEALGWYRKTA